eukprot:5791557-Alexandrium_andersonii.AAC.1
MSASLVGSEMCIRDSPWGRPALPPGICPQAPIGILGDAGGIEEGWVAGVGGGSGGAAVAGVRAAGLHKCQCCRLPDGQR